MNTQDYNTFWQRIHRAAKENGFPLRLMFELTYRCNFRCKHCYVPKSYRKKGELKTKDVFSILDQLRDIGCFYLGFTGGEPFIRKDIIDILWYAKRCGFEPIIYTNGSLIDKRMADELSVLKPNKVDITIPAMSKGAFERITQMRDSHKRVFGVIDLLHKREVNLGFKTCVLKENENEIKEIQDFAHSLGAQHRLDDMLLPRLDGSKEPYRYRGKLKNTLQATSYKLQATRKDNLEECDFEIKNLIPDTDDRTPITENLFKCGVGVSQAAITPSGELKMCVMIDYPKYKILHASRSTLHAPRFKSQTIPNTEAGPDRNEESTQRANLKDAWKELKELVTSINPDEDYKCDKCELEPYCKWCPAKAWLYNKSFTACEPESRRWAKIKEIL